MKIFPKIWLAKNLCFFLSTLVEDTLFSKILKYDTPSKMLSIQETKEVSNIFVAQIFLELLAIIFDTFIIEHTLESFSTSRRGFFGLNHVEVRRAILGTAPNIE